MMEKEDITADTATAADDDIDAEYMGSFVRRLAQIYMKSSDEFLKFYSTTDHSK